MVGHVFPHLPRRSPVDDGIVLGDGSVTPPQRPADAHPGAGLRGECAAPDASFADGLTPLPAAYCVAPVVEMPAADDLTRRIAQNLREDAQRMRAERDAALAHAAREAALRKAAEAERDQLQAKLEVTTRSLENLCDAVLRAAGFSGKDGAL